LYSLDKKRLELKDVDLSKCVQPGLDSNPQVQAIRLSNEASKDIDKHNFSAAEEKLKKALELDPGDETFTRNLCIVYYNQGNFAIGEKDLHKAETSFKQAVDLCKASKNTDILKTSMSQYSAVLKNLGKSKEAKAIDS